MMDDKDPADRTHQEAVVAALRAQDRRFTVAFSPMRDGEVGILVVHDRRTKAGWGPASTATMLMASMLEDLLADMHDLENGLIGPPEPRQPAGALGVTHIADDFDATAPSPGEYQWVRVTDGGPWVPRRLRADWTCHVLGRAEPLRPVEYGPAIDQPPPERTSNAGGWLAERHRRSDAGSEDR